MEARTEPPAAAEPPPPPSKQHKSQQKPRAQPGASSRRKERERGGKKQTRNGSAKAAGNDGRAADETNWRARGHSSGHSDKPKSSPATEEEEEEEDDGAWRETPWFVGGDGDLVFAQWLLGRCNGLGDSTTPQTLDTVRRVRALYLVQRKLRQELALSTQRASDTSDDVEEEEDDPDVVDRQEETKATATATTGAWPVEQIVQEVGVVLRASRAELLALRRAAQRSNRRFEGGLERVVVAEVVENATELVLSRATSAHLALLERWTAALQEEPEDAEEAVPAAEAAAAAADDQEDDQDDPQASKARERKERKERRRKVSTRSTESVACEQVASFVAFLTTSAETTEAALPPSMSPETQATWTTELQAIVANSRIEPAEEAQRLRVARDLQDLLRREVGKWRRCEVALFGSSLSLFGSKKSDLDMCLIPAGQSGRTKPKQEVVSSRQIRHLLHDKAESAGDAASNAESAEALRELRSQIRKSLEKLVQTLNGLDRDGKSGTKAAADKSGDKKRAKSGQKLAKQEKHRRHLLFFEAQLKMLRRAVTAQLLALGVGLEDTQESVEVQEKAARLRAMVTASRKRSDDLYLLRAMLQRNQCEVRHVIAGARIPIIRFVHKRSGREFECDLCFENVLATRNTLLLRAYATLDDRARALGLAVKHWAKQRGVSDAASGFLSSYSFVLLSIYYLQAGPVRVLPSLQDPRLLKAAGLEPEYYNGVNIAFCTDADVARAFHQQQQQEQTEVSLATLLAGFFAFYATQFDFASRVVTVRAPETPVLKTTQWGARKAKTWRLSIQDPLETARDLGCVLQFKGQEKILQELRRAHELLTNGASFAEEVCASESAVAAAGDGKKKVKAGEEKKAKAGEEKNSVATPLTRAEKRKQKQQEQEKKEHSYVLLLHSADEELTKATIMELFRDFEKSFRVGKIELVSNDASAGEGAAGDETISKGSKTWRVELLTKSQQCPRSLSLKTCVDWDTSDGRGGRVWLHHQELFPTPPCHTCLSPGHETGKCPSEESKEDGDGGAGASDRSESQEGGRAKNGRRHMLRVTLGARGSAVTRKERCKKQQHESQTLVDQKPKAKAKLSAATKPRPPRMEKLDEAEPEPVVAATNTPETACASPPPSPTKAMSGKKTTQKKKRPWRGGRRKQSSKSNNGSQSGAA